MLISETIGQLIGSSPNHPEYSTPIKGTTGILEHIENSFSGYRQYAMNFSDMTAGSQGSTYYFDKIMFPRAEAVAIDYLVFLSKSKDLTDSSSNYIQIQDIYTTPSGTQLAYVQTSFGTTITADGYQWVVVVLKSSSLNQELRGDGEAAFTSSLTQGIKKITTQGILPGSKWKKIGIQADPGFVYFVNGEPIMVGRSGFSETPDDYTVSAIGFLNENFVCDYYIDKDA
jgi:hypothetical protein